jgi:hypothetical protein
MPVASPAGMATKSQKLQPPRATKSAQKKPRPRRDVNVDTSLPGVSATDRKAGLKNGQLSTAARNVHRAGKPNATHALEDSATGKPSRKSTRGSADHAKRDSNLRNRETRRVRSPAARQAKAAARRVSPRSH